MFDEVKHYITDFKTFVKYFCLLNGNTDRQVITLCLEIAFAEIWYTSI